MSGQLPVAPGGIPRTPTTDLPQTLSLPTHEEPSWRTSSRRAAFERAKRLGLPTKRALLWGSAPMKLLTPKVSDLQPGAAKAEIPELDAYRIHLVDGTIHHMDTLPETLSLRTLKDIDPGDVFNCLDGGLDGTTDLIDALSREFLILEAEGTTDKPVHLILERSGPGVSSVRVEIRVGENANLTLLEHHVGGTADDQSFLHLRTMVAPHGHLEHERLNLSPAAHMTDYEGSAEADAQLHVGLVQLAGSGVRHSMTLETCGENAHVNLHGLYGVQGKEITDVWTRIDHQVPNTTSDVTLHGIVTGKGQIQTTGNVMVRPDAQQTSSEMQLKNLLLSRQGLAQATPQLEIHADDVECAHGSTTGELDKQALFFLRSRGISSERAKQMLTEAFARAPMDQTERTDLQAYLLAALNGWFEEAIA